MLPVLINGLRLDKLLRLITHLLGALCFLCSVVGPAITFRIRPNAKNLTAADVADKAGTPPVCSGFSMRQEILGGRRKKDGSEDRRN